MGWFWGASDNGSSGSSSQDPLDKLDPSLRDYLSKEAPSQYRSTNPPAQPHAQPVHPPQPSAEPRTTSTQSDSTSDGPKVPPQSLFPDGRYASIWSTYTPQAESEAAAKSDAEKVSDVLEGYKERQAEIGRAALENCALEQWDVNECFKSGGWASRLTMCRAENRKLERCYLMQARFLKALGYLSIYDRPREVDEQIQMHADTLYHRMLEQEDAIEAAKAEGRPLPEFPPILSQAKAVKTKAKKLDSSELSPEVQEDIKKRLEGLSPEEKVIEQQALEAELAAGQEVLGTLASFNKMKEEERRRRKEQGTETVGDKVSSLFGFR